MISKKEYQDTMNEIHVPSEVLGKVREYPMKNKNLKRKHLAKMAGGIAAAFALAFVVSNGICYAATGETWVEKTFTYHIVSYDGDGTGTATLTITDSEGKKTAALEDAENLDGTVFVYVEGSEAPDCVYFSLDGESLSKYDRFNAFVQEADGRQLLTLESDSAESVTEDITEDLADGTASGEIEYLGKTYRYEVTPSGEAYDISLTLEE